jgi:acetylornithine deacetylase/succinyl-diaminopimelate desuccinylase-like protein
VDRLIVEIAGRAEVRAARRWLERHDAATLQTQRALARIPAPTGGEAERASFLAEALRHAGLDARTDAAGNVVAGLGDGDSPPVALAAHLDTVFVAGTPLEIGERDGRITGPGIGDNARGLAALVAVARACRAVGLTPPRPLLLVGTVGEEGAGDLRGVRHLFEDCAFRPAAFIALDGAGLDRVVHRALGSRRLRAVFRGPGGHSWAAFGAANPAHAAGFAAAGVAELSLPAVPRTTASVVRIGGGSALNAIPSEAWLELDLRSEGEAALERLWGATTRALGKALDKANRRRAAGTPPLTLELEPLGTRPSGATDAAHPLVQAAVAATRHVGASPELAAASTDANVAISLGIPAIALGAGGKGGDTHRETEWYENENGPAGLYRALLVALAAAEWAGGR